MQGRAHTLLKSKDAELRATKESAEASSGAELADAKEAASKAQAESAKVVFQTARADPPSWLLQASCSCMFLFPAR